MKQYYVYLTTNLVNNKKYIGQHYGELTDSYLGSGSIFKKALKKYGVENFKKEILYIAKDEKELNEKEQYYIKLHNAVKDPNYYNLLEGGSNEYSLERKEKISNSLKGENHPFYGKHHSEETKNKIKESLKKYWTEERRKEQSERYKGEKNPMYGKHHSKETIQKIIQNNDYTSYRTEEYRQKMSKATSGEKNGNYGNIGEKAKNGKHILMYDENYKLIKIFNTKKMALEFLNTKGHTALDKAIREKKLYKGYYWEQQN